MCWPTVLWPCNRRPWFSSSGRWGRLAWDVGHLKDPRMNRNIIWRTNFLSSHWFACLSFSFIFCFWCRRENKRNKGEKTKKCGFSLKVPRSKSPNFWVGMGSHSTHQWAIGACWITAAQAGRVRVRGRGRCCKKKTIFCCCSLAPASTVGRNARKLAPRLFNFTE